MITAHIIITPKRSVLDPQGEAVKKALQSLGLEKVKEARVGKFIELELSEPATPALKEKLQTICHDLLSNPVIEDYLLNLDAPGSEPTQADYEGLEEPDEESVEDLVKLEAKPKKAAKKLAKADKKVKKAVQIVKKVAPKVEKETKLLSPAKDKVSDQAKAGVKSKEIKDLSEARPQKTKKASGSGSK